MFTSCPECGTVFRIGPAELRRAGGRVRCGTCGTAFSALESLSDSAPAEAGANATLAPDAAGDATETADAASREPAPEALEFDVPPDRWSSFFAAPPADPEATLDPAPLDAAASGDWDELLADLQEGEAEDGDDEDGHAAVYVIDAQAEAAPVVRADAPPPVAPAPDSPPPDYPAEQGATTVDLPPPRERLYPAPPRSAAAGPDPDPAAMAEAATESAIGTAAAAPLAALRPARPEPNARPGASPFGPARPARRRRWTWWLGSLLLLLLLAGQWLHLERDTLAAHPAWGPLVRQAYARLGLTLYPAWDLAAYRVLGSEAVAGRAAPDALEIVARLQVTGAAPAGLPLLRVSIRDRWGNTVGERLVAPADYAPARAGELVAPGSVLPLTVSLRDPGSEAHGYEIDLCLPRRDQGMDCQQDRQVFRR